MNSQNEDDEHWTCTMCTFVNEIDEDTDESE